jgi:CRISPR-associated protein Cmr3
LNHWIPKTENLELTSISLSNDIASYFPMPEDLLVLDSNQIRSKGSLNSIQLELDLKPHCSNILTDYQLINKKQIQGKKIEGQKIISSLELQNYLNQETNVEVMLLSNFYENEIKIGIGRNKLSHVAENGRLYRINTFRPAKDSNGRINHLLIQIGYKGIEDFPANGLLTLGGERRTASFKHNEAYSLDLPNIETNRFKIYLSTPSVFKSGWYPKRLLESHNLKLLTAVVGSPLHLGGWDLKPKNNSGFNRPQPKPMLRFVPAGSVYYVEAPSIELAKEAASIIHASSISEIINETDYPRQGFGIAYIGKI